MAAETVREKEQGSILSFDQYLKLAQQGDADAQYKLAKLYLKGTGVKQDDKQAVYWLRKTALQNQADAQGTLGSMYAEGRGVPRDFCQARRWWRWGVQMGNAEAQRLQELYNSTGSMPISGGEVTQGQKVPDEAAIGEYISAAEQGDPDSQFRLAELYADGDVVSQNLPEAWKWLRKSSEQGSSDAQFFLGAVYLSGGGEAVFKSDGKGVKKNVKLGMQWLNRSAAQENFTAQSLLAIIYAEGREEVDKDYALAEYWLKKAAAYGSPEVQTLKEVEESRRKQSSASKTD